ncbi:MAG: hypothetical protein FWB79_05130, partial [Treponema sp.]|nr:hypothetical protein [Treponema sp.]
MKNVLKLLGLIALVAVMGLAMVGCGSSCPGDGNCGITMPANPTVADLAALANPTHCGDADCARDITSAIAAWTDHTTA